MADQFLQGVQIGHGLAENWANRDYRLQQLRVNEAYRQMQERHLAKQAEELEVRTKIEKAKYDQDQYDMLKLRQADQMYRERVDSLTRIPQGQVGPVIDPEQARVIASDEVLSTLQFSPTAFEKLLKIRNAMATAVQKKAESNARVDQLKASADLSRARADRIDFGDEEGGGYTVDEVGDGQLVIQSKKTGGIRVIDQNKEANHQKAAQKMAVFRSNMSALKTKLSKVDNDLTVKFNPDKRAKAISDIEDQMKAETERFLSENEDQKSSKPSSMESESIPEAPRDPSKRKPGKYVTPRGVLYWNGNAWEQP